MSTSIYRIKVTQPDGKWFYAADINHWESLYFANKERAQEYLFLLKDEENRLSIVESYVVETEDFVEINRDQTFLRALEQQGVDNWEWYGEACDLVEEWEKVKNG